MNSEQPNTTLSGSNTINALEIIKHAFQHVIVVPHRLHTSHPQWAWKYQALSQQRLFFYVRYSADILAG